VTKIDYRNRTQEEKLRHLDRHSGAVSRLLAPNQKSSFAQLLSPQPSAQGADLDTSAFLDLLRERVLTYRKPQAAGKHMLFAVSDTGGWAGVAKLIELACQSKDVCQVSLYASGIALHERFMKSELSSLFREVQDPKASGALYANLCALNETGLVSNRPVDTVVATVATSYGPEAVSLFSAKSILEAKRLFLVMEAWGTLGVAYNNGRAEMDEVDGILCNDQLAKQLICHLHPSYDPNRIFMTGTGQLEPNDLQSAQHRQAMARELFKLRGDEVVVFWGGDYFTPGCGLRESFNIDTRDKLIRAVIEAAARTPEKKYAVLIRPHPGDSGEGHEQALDISEFFQGLPANVRLIDASKYVCDMQTAACVSHLVASIGSTETFKVPYTGARGVFLTFDEPGLAGPLYEKGYPNQIRAEIERQSGITVVRTERQLSDLIAATESRFRDVTQQAGSGPSENMLRVLLSESS
jgi:hypothetical protein